MIKIYRKNIPAGLFQRIKKIGIDDINKKLAERGVILVIRQPRVYGSFIINLELCKKSAARFNRPNDWKKNDPHIYAAARRKRYPHEDNQHLNWYIECTRHMVKNKPKGKVAEELAAWTLDMLKESALKCKSPGEWMEKDPKAYEIARKKGVVKLCTEHMKLPPVTLDLCKLAASKFKDITGWIENDFKTYNKAYFQGWLTECTAHMSVPCERNEASLHHAADELYQEFKTPLDLCKSTALKFKDLTEWMMNNWRTYNRAVWSGWLTDCTMHMECEHDERSLRREANKLYREYGREPNSQTKRKIR